MKREHGQIEPQEANPQVEKVVQGYTEIMTGVWADEEGNVVSIRDSLMKETLELKEEKIISRVSDK